MLKKAFTLIELLIVIAIIGILGVGLLIALDPIEQTRRASDTTILQSAVEIKDAVNRFYASKLYYPWCADTSVAGSCDYLGANGCTADATSAVGTSGTCGNYVVASLLVNTGELKSTPPATIMSALSLVTGGSGTTFALSFNPASKSFDSNLTYLFSDTACATAGTTVTCASPNNNCNYCLR